MVRPMIVQDRPAVVQVWPPGDEVAVYPLTPAPPLTLGAAQDTVVEVLFGVVVSTEVGAPGVMVTPHLLARYSSTARRSAVSTAC